jgi:periplasmic divalent cation tolerance protein
MTGLVVIQTTTASRHQAEQVAQMLLERRLAACVQMTEIDSLYRWKGALEREREILLSIKTRAALYAKVEAAILEVHPYDTPEIVALTVDQGAPSYLAWVAGQTELDGPDD